jgi:SWI/SNF-related matrix-associated actin-dependent regulator of chromatin subfamily A3
MLHIADHTLHQLCDIPVNPSGGFNINSIQIPVGFRYPHQLSSNCGAISFEIRYEYSATLLAELRSITEISTQLYCHLKEVNSDSEGHHHQRQGKRRRKKQQLWYLNIILYGAQCLGDKIGDYLSRRKMYLQDPLGCTHCVPYLNPHVITSDSSEIVMSDSFDIVGDLGIERLEPGPDLLARLMEDDVSLPETEAPESVISSLFM